MVGAAQAAAAAAANVAAAAETRLAVARGGAAAAGGLFGAGLIGSLLKSAMLAAGVYVMVKTISDVAEANKNKFSAGGTAEAISDNLNPFGRPDNSSRARKMLMAHAKPGQGDQGGAGDDQGLKLSMIRQPLISSIADAWKQAQMQVTTGIGAAGDTITLQRQQLFKLQEIAANTRGDTPIGPQP